MSLALVSVNLPATVLRRLLAAGAACAVLASLLAFSARPAEAQSSASTPHVDTLWQATLTPKSINSAAGLGCRNAESTTANKCSTAATLSYRDDFTLNNSYTFAHIELVNSSKDLVLYFNRHVTDALKGFTLHAGTSTLALSDATITTDGSLGKVVWSSTGLTWTADTGVPLKLVGPTTSTTTVWETELTVAVDSGISTTLGCSSQTTITSCSTALADDDFTQAGSEHTVETLTVDTSGLRLGFSNDLPLALRTLTLHVDDATFKFGDGDWTAGWQHQLWTENTPTWASGDTVDVKLVASQFGTPVVQFGVGTFVVPGESSSKAIDVEISPPLAADSIVYVLDRGLEDTRGGTPYTEPDDYTFSGLTDGEILTLPAGASEATFTINGVPDYVPDCLGQSLGKPSETCNENLFMELEKAADTPYTLHRLLRRTTALIFDDSVSLWSATLTPQSINSGGGAGCRNAESDNADKCTTTAALSDDDFTLGSTTFSFTHIELVNSNKNLVLYFDRAITDALKGFTLRAGSAQFALADATITTESTLGKAVWEATGQTWAVGTELSLSLVASLAPGVARHPGAGSRDGGLNLFWGQPSHTSGAAVGYEVQYKESAAPDTGNIGEVWSATLTVDRRGGSEYAGCDDNDSQQDDCSTNLTENEFVYGGTTYTVTEAYADTDIEDFRIKFDPPLPPQFDQRGSLVVDDDTLRFKDARRTSGNKQILWPAGSYTRDLADGTEVELRLGLLPFDDPSNGWAFGGSGIEGIRYAIGAELWKSTLTVVGSTTPGCQGTGTPACSTNLTENEFTHDGSGFRVVNLLVKADGNLFMQIDPVGDDTVRLDSSWALMVDGVEYKFSDATFATQGRNATWSKGPTWSAGDEVELELFTTSPLVNYRDYDVRVRAVTSVGEGDWGTTVSQVAPARQRELWSATLDVISLSTDTSNLNAFPFGCDNDHSLAARHCSAKLDDADITIAGIDYAVTLVSNERPSEIPTDPSSLLFETKPAVRTAAPNLQKFEEDYTLVVDGLQLPMGGGLVRDVGQTPGEHGSVSWSHFGGLNADLWSPGQMVKLSLQRSLFRPVAPTALTLAAGDGQLDASWSAPEDPGASPVTGYNVQHRKTNSVIWSATLTVQELSGIDYPHTGDVRGCQALNTAADRCALSSVLSDNDFSYGGATYTIDRLLDYRASTQTLVSKTFVELGCATQSCDLRTALDDLTLHVDELAFPLVGATHRNGNRWFDWGESLGWSAGETVKLELRGPGAWSNAGSAGLGATKTVTGLDNLAYHDVRVRAINAEGSGAWSDPVTEAPRPDDVFWYAELIAKDLGTDSFGCWLVEPSFCSDTARLTDDDFTVGENDYTVGALYVDSIGELTITWGTELTDAAATALSPFVLWVDDTQFLIAGIDESATLTASAVWADGPDWRARQFVRLQLRLGHVPTGLTLAPDVRKIDASWKAPSDPDYTPIDYDVEYKRSEASSWRTAADPGTDTSVTIDGLDNYQSYDVRVRAESTADGEGDWSAPATTFVMSAHQSVVWESDLTVGKTYFGQGCGSPSTRNHLGQDTGADCSAEMSNTAISYSGHNVQYVNLRYKHMGVSEAFNGGHGPFPVCPRTGCYLRFAVNKYFGEADNLTLIIDGRPFRLDTAEFAGYHYGNIHSASYRRHPQWRDAWNSRVSPNDHLAHKNGFHVFTWHAGDMTWTQGQTVSLRLVYTPKAWMGQHHDVRGDAPVHFHVRERPATGPVDVEYQGFRPGRNGIRREMRDNLDQYRLEVRLSRPAGPGGVTAKLVVDESSTASFGHDYEFLSPTDVFFPQGSAWQIVYLRIVDDDHDDSGETIVINLEAPGHDTKGMIVTIHNDDDGTPPPEGSRALPPVETGKRIHAPLPGKSDNTDLRHLSAPYTGTLHPAFDPAVTEYKVHITKRESIRAYLWLKAFAAHSGATVRVDDRVVSDNQGFQRSASGSLRHQRPIKVEVTAEDTYTTKTYTLVPTLDPVPAPEPEPDPEPSGEGGGAGEGAGAQPDDSGQPGESEAEQQQTAAAVGKPGPVSGLRLSFTAAGLAVSWAAPQTGGSPDRYLVRLKPADGGRAKDRSVSAPGTAANFGNLRAGVAYEVVVRAANAAGKSAKVRSSITAPALPGPPANLQLSASGSSVTATWGAPSSGGTAASYLLNIKRTGSRTDSYRTVAADTTSAVFDNLQPGATYRVWIRAVNVAGKSSKARASVTLAAPQPQPETVPEPDPEPQQSAATFSVSAAPQPADSSDAAAAHVAEGAEATLTVTLSEAAPEGGVAFTVTPGYGGESTTPASAADVGRIASAVTVAAGDTSVEIAVPTVDDEVYEGDETFTVTVAAASDGWVAESDGADTATVTIGDDDTAGVTVSAVTLSVSEDGTASYTVVLDSEPKSAVAVRAVSADPGAATVSPASHTFTPTSWRTPRTFTVAGVADRDRVDETVRVRHATVSGSDGYRSGTVVAAVVVTVADTTAAPAEPEDPANAWRPYDTDADGCIDRDEYNAAIRHYAAGKFGYLTILAIIRNRC